MEERKICESDAKTLHEGRRRMYEASDVYRRSFVNPSSGLIVSELTENRACPVCEATSDRIIFIKNGGTYVKCGSCGMIYLNPVLKDDELRKYYENNNAMQAAAHENESEFYRSIYTKGLYSIERFVKKGSILDIGCSSGFFLDIAKERGWNTYGIELNRSEFIIAHEKGHNVWNSPLEETPFDTKLTAITMWDVLEHIKRGWQYLEMLRKLLADDGVIFIQCPSSSSLAARILQERCNMFDGIEHVNLYTPKSISTLCNKAGYRVLHMETVIDEIQVLKKYLDYEDPYFSDRDGASDITFLTGELIHKAQLGYKIQIVIKPC
ncbi:MAG: class I SAM-dependent methyltransferase [Anaerolinea sp.]|nr:class I SAM-dependent methyltransferase [Anaerolinea sp.]